MKNIILTIFLALLMVVAFVSPASAGLFDDRYPSPRVLAMGGAGVATANTVWASYYNPSGLSRLSNFQVGSSYMRLYNLEFFNNIFGAAALPINTRYGGVSVSFQHFGVDYRGESVSGETTIAISHGFYLLNDIQSSLALGYSLKSYHLNFGTSVDGLELGSAMTYGIDVGLQASVYSRTHIGLYFLNINNPQVGEGVKHDLPQRIVAGIAYQPYDGVTTTFDLNRLLGADDMEFWGGAEFDIIKFLTFRFGGTTNPGRFSAGVGIKIEKLSIDYGMRTHSELGETHSIGIRYGL